MASDGQRRAGAKAGVVDSARKRAGVVLPDWLDERTAGLGRLVSQWVLSEVAPGRLVPWLAVAFGSSIVLYFTVGREPSS
jgi:competence protein ComEC